MANKTASSTAPLSLLMALFILSGFASVLNTVLIPYLQTILGLSYSAITLIPVAFYTAYFLISPLHGAWGKNKTYLQGIRAGLITSAVGSLCLAWTSNEIPVYPVVLLSLFTLGSGIAMCQVSGNPYVVQLGSLSQAASRMALVHASTSIGMIAAPFIGSHILLSALTSSSSPQDNGPLFILYSFLILGWILILACSYSSRLPALKPEQRQGYNSAGASPTLAALKNPYLLYGMAAIATSIGIEVSCSSFMVRFLSSEHILQVPLDSAGKFSTLFWILFTLGRISASILLRHFKQESLLFVFSLTGIFLGLLTINSSELIGAFAVLSFGLSTSILFPVVFTITLSNTKVNHSIVSGLLCMANIGGALFPLAQGIIADSAGIHASYLVPLLGFLFLACYAFTALRRRQAEAQLQ